MCSNHVPPEGGYFPPPWWVTIGVTLGGVAVLMLVQVFHG